MEEALRKYKVEDEVQNLSEVQILEYISYLHYLLGIFILLAFQGHKLQILQHCLRFTDDGLTALEWTNKLLTIEPNNQHALKYIPYYVKKVRENKKILEMGNALDDEDEDEIYLEADTKMYETLCRGEMELPSQIVSKWVVLSYNSCIQHEF